MRKALKVTCAMLVMAASAFAGVTVSSPTAGSTVSSPTHFVASATGTSTITSMRIYVDNVSVYAIAASSINTNVTMSTGQHFVVVQAWDSHGNVYKASENITVSSTTTSVPSNAITKSRIEEMTGWQNCTVCAGANGNGSVAIFSMTQNVASPSLDGKSAKFFLGGSTPYSDALWWKQLGAFDSATHFKYDLDFYLTNPTVAQALEFDANQSNGAHKFIFGTQCNVAAKLWDVYDPAGGAWHHTTISCPAPAALKWHHITWEFQRTSTQVVYVALTYDGVKHFINRTYTAKSSSVHELNVAVQLDGNSKQVDYSEWVDRISIAYW